MLTIPPRLCRCEVSGSAWRRGTDVDEDDDTEASDVAENDYDEEGTLGL